MAASIYRQTTDTGNVVPIGRKRPQRSFRVAINLGQLVAIREPNYIVGVDVAGILTLYSPIQSCPSVTHGCIPPLSRYSPATVSVMSFAFSRRSCRVKVASGSIRHVGLCYPPRGRCTHTRTYVILLALSTLSGDATLELVSAARVTSTGRFRTGDSERRWRSVSSSLVSRRLRPPKWFTDHE